MNDKDTVVVPREPTEEMWGGLARQIILWMDMHPMTPRALFDHLRCSGHDVPQWLRDEPEMQNLDHVPSKGTRAVLIYRAMLAAAPSTSVREEVGALVTRLRAYRPVDEWGEGVRHTICDEAADALETLAALKPSTDKGGVEHG